MTEVRRILSIDGGGIMGTFPASFLATLEESINGNSIANYFDLIVGTSTGGIIALGLGLGLSAKEILEFYENYGPDIFSGNNFIKSLWHWIIAKHDSRKLREGLAKTFGSKLLGESKVRLVIPAMKENGEIYLWKTNHLPDYRFDHNSKVVDVALATSAAPSYFSTHRSSSGLALIDGGMWANNPSVIGVVEATIKLGWDRSSLRVLSLGCSTAPVDLGWLLNLPLGKLFWAGKSVDLFMAGQSSFSSGVTNLMVGNDNFIRINPIFRKDRFKLDGYHDIPVLKGLGADESRKNLSPISNKFLYALAQPYQESVPRL